MTTASIRELAAWHAAEAATLEKQADALNDGRFHADAEIVRIRAQWHASTAIHLDALADAFGEAFQPANDPERLSA